MASMWYRCAAWSLMATCFPAVPNRAMSYVFGLIPTVRCLPSLIGLLVLENLIY
jgi:hypothetical protein